jgi:hypothetical protein
MNEIANLHRSPLVSLQMSSYCYKIRNWIQFLVLVLVMYALSGCNRASMPEWEEYSNLGQELNFNVSQIIAFKGALWFVAQSEDNYQPLVFKFDPEKRILKSYYIQNDQGQVTPEKLFITNDNELIGGGLVFSLPDYMKRLSFDCKLDPPLWLISKYNETTDKFDLIKDNAALLRGCQMMAMANDREKNLWILDRSPIKERLIMYSFKSNEAKVIDYTQLFKVDRIISVVNDQNGFLWFQVNLEGQNKIIRYDPIADHVYDYGCPQSTCDYIYAFYFDKSQKLWTSNIAWLDWKSPIPLWHLENNELFLQPPEPGWSYKEIDQPDQIFQTSDERIWFASTKKSGLISFDSQQNRWEKNRETDSPITEMDGYAWIIENGKIFRLPILKSR